MAIDVSHEFEQEIQRRVQDGHYPSAEALLRETFRRADEYGTALRAAIAEARAQADRDELVDGEAVFDRIDAELERAENRRGGG
jgi:Arc/MetJ-type ribon-helix-helix transcriptional regulator